MGISPNSKFQDITYIISKVGGAAVVVFSFCTKLPQIIKILKNHRVDGISIISLLMEMSVNIISFTYHRFHHFPFSTYGETLIIFIQNMFLSFCVVHISSKTNLDIYKICVVSYFSLIFAVEKSLVNKNVMSVLWGVCIFLSISQKIPQIFLMFRIKRRGNFSQFSAFLVLSGASVRLFTTFREIHDLKIIITSSISFILNFTIFIQSLVYEPGKQDSSDVIKV